MLLVYYKLKKIDNKIYNLLNIVSLAFKKKSEYFLVLALKKSILFFKVKKLKKYYI